MKLAVIGVGLIGGSFAMALRKAGAVSRVVGVGRSARNLELARERGIIDAIERDAAAAARDADLVLVAAPVAQFASIFSSLRESKAIITDGGSTKRDVIAAARQALGGGVARFVPAHPIAGAEKSGAAAASADLFHGKRVVLTPLQESSRDVVTSVSAAWQTCGARVSEMPADEHDAVLAAVSHLPHLLAFALVHEVAGRGNSEQLFSFAAGGFRDFTRIASSHPEMWRDICAANKDKLLVELERFMKKLQHVERLLDDPAGLERIFAEARAARGRWLNGEFEA